VKDGQKSAEGILAITQMVKVQTGWGVENRTSMDERDAERRAERPKDSREVAGGTGEKKERERQASAAAKEKAQPEAERLLEEVLRRENMRSALRRVRSNKGGPGIGGMTVEELVPYLKMEWPRIREELLKGTYRPMPVR
jgi:RNA-directed DNA polymerase